MSAGHFPTFRRPFRRLLRVLRWIAIVLMALIVLSALPWTYYNLKYGHELEQRLADLKAKGAPMTLVEAAPKPVPEDQNAAALYDKAFAILSPAQGQPQLIPELAHGELQYYGMGHTATKPAPPIPPGVPLASAPPSSAAVSNPPAVGAGAQAQPPTDEQAKALLLNPALQQALQYLREGSLRPYAIFPINWEAGMGAHFSDSAHMREATRMICAQARSLAYQGKMDEALGWCEVALRMSQQVAAEPVLIPQLVSNAMLTMTCKILQMIISEQSLSPAQVQHLERLLSQLDPVTPFAQAMVGERAAVLQAYGLLRHNPRDFLLGGHVGTEPTLVERALANSFTMALLRPMVLSDEGVYLDGMAQILQLDLQPYAQSKASLDQLDQSLKAMRPWRIFMARVILPPLTKAVWRRDEAVARISVCRVALALKAYKSQHGSYPATLDDLQRTLTWTIPLDPFSSKHLIYLTEGPACKVYSIGSNLRDDSGVPYNYKTKVGAPAAMPVTSSGENRPDDIIWECLK